MGAAFCCKKPEEIVVEEYKNSENNGDIDKINAIDQDSYPKDTELVNKANIIYEEQEVSNQKLYEQEGSQKEDGAYEVPINSPSPSKNKQVEISEQNNNQTPENEDNQDEIQNINVNQYSQEELEMYQNQLRINIADSSKALLHKKSIAKRNKLQSAGKVTAEIIRKYG